MARQSKANSMLRSRGNSKGVSCSPQSVPANSSAQGASRRNRTQKTALPGVTTRKCSECTASWTKHARAARRYVRCTPDDCRSGGRRSHVSDVPRADIWPPASSHSFSRRSPLLPSRSARASAGGTAFTPLPCPLCAARQNTSLRTRHGCSAPQKARQPSNGRCSNIDHPCPVCGPW